MLRSLLLLVALALTACGSGSSTPVAGPVVLQERTEQAHFSARTDGERALVLAFTGAATESVAGYAAEVQTAGDDVRIVLEERDAAGQPVVPGPRRSSGTLRSLRVELDEPLRERRVVDEMDRQVLLLDGAQLLRPGRLPAGWSDAQEREGFPPYLWQYGISGPDRRTGASLFQGGREAGRMLDGEGYREVASPEVRGEPGVLARSELGTWTLTWTEGERGFLLQLRGEVDDPGALLVELADGLV